MRGAEEIFPAGRTPLYHNKTRFCRDFGLVLVAVEDGRKVEQMSEKIEEEKSNPKTIRSCEVETKFEDGDGKVFITMEKVEEVLKEHANCIRDYAYIIHDQDTYTAEEEQETPEHKAGTLKAPHIHVLLRFDRNQPQQFKSIAEWFGLEPQCVQKIKGRWEDAVLYLTHENAPEKFQYSADDVVANFNVQTIINRAKERKKLDKILTQILTGEIREYNKTLAIDNLILVYQSKKINEAFKLRAEHLQATEQNRNTEVIFITGESGTGKTTLAKKIATERGLAYFVSSGSNDVMDGYGQQPCLILDDVRPSCLGLSDLLKLLDNHTATSIKSRYKNKYLNCDLVILTSVLDLDTFYNNVFEREREPITQLKRRCGTYIQMFRRSIIVSRWDNATMQYSAPLVFQNDILTQYVAPTPKNLETVQAEVQKLMPFLTPDTISDELLKRLHARPISNETITDEAFAALMPPKEEGEHGD